MIKLTLSEELKEDDLQKLSSTSNEVDIDLKIENLKVLNHEALKIIQEKKIKSLFVSSKSEEKTTLENFPIFSDLEILTLQNIIFNDSFTLSFGKTCLRELYLENCDVSKEFEFKLDFLKLKKLTITRFNINLKEIYYCLSQTRRLKEFHFTQPINNESNLYLLHILDEIDIEMIHLSLYNFNLDFDHQIFQLKMKKLTMEIFGYIPSFLKFFQLISELKSLNLMIGTEYLNQELFFEKLDSLKLNSFKIQCDGIDYGKFFKYIYNNPQLKSFQLDDQGDSDDLFDSVSQSKCLSQLQNLKKFAMITFELKNVTFISDKVEKVKILFLYSSDDVFKSFILSLLDKKKLKSLKIGISQKDCKIDIFNDYLASSQIIILKLNFQWNNINLDSIFTGLYQNQYLETLRLKFFSPIEFKIDKFSDLFLYNYTLCNIFTDYNDHFIEKYFEKDLKRNKLLKTISKMNILKFRKDTHFDFK